MTENKKNRRTSYSQFETIVEYMEKYGDLTQFTLLNLWDELTDVLNADKSGDVKSIDKWRKVWTDLKNQTKRKAVKCQSSEPGYKARLTNLEQRVLHLAKSQRSRMMEVFVIEEATPEIITEPPMPIILDVNQNNKQQNFENKKRQFEFDKSQPTSGEETSADIDFRIKQCKTVVGEEELHSLRIKKEKLLLIKEEIAINRKEELLNFKKEKRRLELIKLNLEVTS